MCVRSVKELEDEDDEDEEEEEEEEEVDDEDEEESDVEGSFVNVKADMEDNSSCVSDSCILRACSMRTFRFFLS